MVSMHLRPRSPHYCWFLLASLAVLAFGATDASAYDLAAGTSHVCVIDDNGVSCWGNNDYGQSTVPAGPVNPSAVAPGEGHICLLDDNGVECSGDPERAPLGLLVISP